MVARGLLANPAMFAGYEETPLKCIWDWVDIALELGTPYMCFHQHLMYMMEKITSRQEKRERGKIETEPRVGEPHVQLFLATGNKYSNFLQICQTYSVRSYDPNLKGGNRGYIPDF